MDILVGFLLGITGNIIAAYLYDNLKTKDTRLPPFIHIVYFEKFATKNDEKSLHQFDYCFLNRQIVYRRAIVIAFFVFTFIILWVLILVSIGFSQGMLNQYFDLAEVKVLGWFTDALVPTSYVRLFSIFIAIIAYFPLLLLGDRLLIVIEKWYNKFLPVTFEAWIRLRAITFCILSIFFCWIILFFTSTWSIGLILATPVLVLILLVISVLSLNSK